MRPLVGIGGIPVCLEEGQVWTTGKNYSENCLKAGVGVLQSLGLGEREQETTGIVPMPGSLTAVTETSFQVSSAK